MREDVAGEKREFSLKGRTARMACSSWLLMDD